MGHLPLLRRLRNRRPRLWTSLQPTRTRIPTFRTSTWDIIPTKSHQHPLPRFHQPLVVTTCRPCSCNNRPPWRSKGALSAAHNTTPEFRPLPFPQHNRIATTPTTQMLGSFLLPPLCFLREPHTSPSPTPQQNKLIQQELSAHLLLLLRAPLYRIYPGQQSPTPHLAITCTSIPMVGQARLTPTQPPEIHPPLSLQIHGSTALPTISFITQEQEQQQHLHTFRLKVQMRSSHQFLAPIQAAMVLNLLMTCFHLRLLTNRIRTKLHMPIKATLDREQEMEEHSLHISIHGDTVLGPTFIQARHPPFVTIQTTVLGTTTSNREEAEIPHHTTAMEVLLCPVTPLIIIP